MSLIYLGGAALIGIPARDLTDDEVEKFGGEKFLLKSGLYTQPAQPKQGKTKQAPALSAAQEGEK